jgi:hypothetical protein
LIDKVELDNTIFGPSERVFRDICRHSIFTKFIWLTLTKQETLILSTETKLLDSDCVPLVITSVNLEYCKINRGAQLHLSKLYCPNLADFVPDMLET